MCQKAGYCHEIYELFESARWVLSILENGTLRILEQAVNDRTKKKPDEVADRSEEISEENPRLDDDCEFGLRKIAKAARLSVSHFNGNVSKLFFQVYARLLELSNKSSVVRSFLNDVERCTETLAQGDTRVF